MNLAAKGVEQAVGVPLGAGGWNAASPDSPSACLERYVLDLEPEMVAFRRDLHRHPEASNMEFRTSGNVVERLEKAGLKPRVPAGSTAVVCDIPGVDPDVPMLALRADLDALPVPDEKAVEYRSTVPGFSHACGHDVHTASVLGAGLALARLSETHGLPVPVRLLFQPAEEKIEGALFMIGEGALEGVGRILGLHCDPKIDAGQVGLKVGALTSACDLVRLPLSAAGPVVPGAASPNPVHAVAALAVGVPDLVSRQMPAGSGVHIVWGHIQGWDETEGAPGSGTALLQCTIRCIDERAWTLVEDLFRRAVDSICAAHGVAHDLQYTRGIPPVINESSSIGLFRQATEAVLGRAGVTTTEQSLGGEDFAWFLRRVPGAMARLGVREPGAKRTLDLHQGLFDVDERAIGIAMRLLSTAALLA